MTPDDGSGMFIGQKGGLCKGHSRRLRSDWFRPNKVLTGEDWPNSEYGEKGSRKNKHYRKLNDSDTTKRGESSMRYRIMVFPRGSEDFMLRHSDSSFATIAGTRGMSTLKEFLWNFDDFLCLSRPGVEASQNIVFNSVFPYVLTEKNRSFNFAKILIF